MDKRMFAEMYMPALRNIIELEIKFQKNMTLSDFYKKMTEVKIGNDFFKAGENTVRRYLKGEDAAGKDTYNFFRASSKVLGFYEGAMMEMIDIYLSIEDKPITLEIYKNYIRPKGLAYNKSLAAFLKSNEYTKMKKAAFPQLQLIESIEKIISKRPNGFQADIIAIYNASYDFTQKMKDFWMDCLTTMYDCIDYFDRIDKEISKINMNLEITPDFWILLKIKNGDKKNSCEHLNLRKLKTQSDDVDWEWLAYVMFFCQLKEEYRNKFWEIALKYSFLKRQRDFTFLAQKENQE